jgi:hypothetical protein
MTVWIKQSSTQHALRFFLVQSSDHITGLTGASPTVKIGKAGSTGAAPSGAVTEIDSTNLPGWYKVAANATDTNTLGSIDIHATAASADPCDVMDAAFVVPFDPTDTVRMGLTALPNVASGSAGAIPTTGTGSNQISVSSGQVILQAGTGTGQLDFTSGVVKANVTQFGGSAGTFASGRPEVNTTHIAGTISPAVAGKVGIDLAQVSLYAAGAFAPTGIVDSGTAQSATGTTLVLRSAAAFADSELVGATVVIRTATTGAGQRRLITANVGSTDTVTVDTWTTTPTGTITYDIFGSPPSSATSPAQADVVKWNGTAVSSPATAGIPEVNVKNINNVSTSAVTTIKAVQGLTTADTISALAANTITATSINVAAFSSAKFAADTGLVPIRSNTAQAGAATTITLDASASASNSFYNNCIVLITGGTGVGQARFITAYVGATKVATVATWVTNPDNTSTFAILPFDAVAGASAPTVAQIATGLFQDLTSGSDFTTAGSFGKLIVDNLNATITSRMASYTQPTGFLAATFPSGTVANTTNITAGTITTVTNLTNAPTSGDFTATMKTSIGTAVAASAVASVTGNVGGNVTGSVGSVVGAVGSVTGAVGSVTGNVGGNVTGSVGSVVGAVGSVTGAVGSVTGAVGSVTGAVGSVTATVDVGKVNGVTLQGTGVLGDSWRPV